MHPRAATFRLVLSEALCVATLAGAVWCLTGGYAEWRWREAYPVSWNANVSAVGMSVCRSQRLLSINGCRGPGKCDEWDLRVIRFQRGDDLGIVNGRMVPARKWTSVSVPIWTPVLASALLVLIAHRKWRHTRLLRRGFPVRKDESDVTSVAATPKFSPNACTLR